MGTPFACVPAAFQQWERRFDAFSLEMTAYVCASGTVTVTTEVGTNGAAKLSRVNSLDTKDT